MKDMKIESNWEKEMLKKIQSEMKQKMKNSINLIYFFFSLSLTSKMEHEDSISETGAMVGGLSHSIKENDKL